MAIFHTVIKVFSRGKGQSAVTAAAYPCGLLLSDLVAVRGVDLIVEYWQALGRDSDVGDIWFTL